MSEGVSKGSEQSSDSDWSSWCFELKKNGKEDATPMKRERKGGTGRAKGLKRNEIISSFW